MLFLLLSLDAVPGKSNCVNDDVWYISPIFYGHTLSMCVGLNF